MGYDLIVEFDDIVSECYLVDDVFEYELCEDLQIDVYETVNKLLDLFIFHGCMVLKDSYKLLGDYLDKFPDVSKTLYIKIYDRLVSYNIDLSKYSVGSYGVYPFTYILRHE